VETSCSGVEVVPVFDGVVSRDCLSPGHSVIKVLKVGVFILQLERNRVHVASFSDVEILESGFSPRESIIIDLEVGVVVASLESY
jgi:hypothetical protein